MSEIGELSEKYEEDEIRCICAVDVIIPLKTVEAGVKMYNTIGNAMKTSAETFVRELPVQKTYARVRPNKMSSLHSLKSLPCTFKICRTSKVFSSTDNLLAKKESNIHISNKNYRTMRMHT